jgi:motility quorum-sensing regulator / GCU-specific mRNA interferase toxin
MEKRRPTYDLDAIKQAIGSVDRLAITTSALRDASAVGFDRGAIVETIGSGERRMFIKLDDDLCRHRLWQDIYHVPMRGLLHYAKFEADVLTEFTIVSFKEK